MKHLIIAMIITNLFLAGQIIADRKQEQELHKQICIEELIPIPEEELEVQ